jgi:hypothetical protein
MDFIKARGLDKQQLLNQIQIGDISFTPQAPNYGVHLPAPGVYNPQQPINYSTFPQPQQYYPSPQLNHVQQPPPFQYGQQTGTYNHNQQHPVYPHQMLPGTWSPNPNPSNSYKQDNK